MRDSRTMPARTARGATTAARRPAVNVEAKGRRTTPASTERNSESAARAHRIGFFRQFLKAPMELGTCFTSGKGLTRALTSHMGLEGATTVVELGPGSGPLTERILELVPAGAMFFTIESNEGLVDLLRKRFPSVTTYHDDALNVSSIARKHGVQPGTVDAVVSSLPFLLFDLDLQDRMLGAISKVLRPGGRFSMVTYRPERIMPSAREFRRLMERHFSVVERAIFVATNIPPGHVYRCTK
jgi:phosphatidylethanolamine/phosphatidyl-N-methylethanolamine N-methyltransferase